MKVISARELAMMTSRSDVTVYKWAKVLGIKPVSGFTEHDAKRIELAIAKAKIGRPMEKKRKRSLKDDAGQESEAEPTQSPQ